MNPLIRSSLLLTRSLPVSRSFSSLPPPAPLSSLPLARPPSHSLARPPPSLSPTLFPSGTQVRHFFNKKDAEESLFEYFGAQRPVFFPPPSSSSSSPSPLEEENRKKIEDIQKNKKPTFVELAKQLQPVTRILKDMVVWSLLFWKYSLQQPEGTMLTRREAALSRLIYQEFRTSAPYLVLFMIPFLGNFLLPGSLLFVANTSPASLPRLFWTDRIRLRARQDLWRRKKQNHEDVHSFLVNFVDKYHDSLQTLDIFDLETIKEGLKDLEGKDKARWGAGVSALIPCLLSEQFCKSEFPSGYKKKLFEAFNPTVKTHGYSDGNFDSYGRYLQGVDHLIEETGVKNLPNKDVVWVCEERGFWGKDPCFEGDLIEDLPFPDEEERVEEMRKKLENWLEISRELRNSDPNFLAYYHILSLFAGPFDKN